MSNAKVFEAVVANILDELKKDNLVWRKPWNFDGIRNELKNPISGTVYSGSNVFYLAITMMSKGWTSPYFATFKQISANGGKVKKGEKGTSIIYWSVIPEKAEKAAKRLNIPVTSVTNDMLRSIPLSPRYYTVFNIAAQTEGYELPADSDIDYTVEPSGTLVQAEIILQNMPNKPEIHTAAKAQYVHTEGFNLEFINMPPASSFDTEEEYYSTLFHELVHSTMAPHRVGRKAGKRETKAYAFEELVAEIGAAMLCGSAGILEMTIQNSAAYVQGWKQSLDAEALHNAIGYAVKAVEYILGD